MINESDSEQALIFSDFLRTRHCRILSVQVCTDANVAIRIVLSSIIQRQFKTP